MEFPPQRFKGLTGRRGDGDSACDQERLEELLGRQSRGLTKPYVEQDYCTQKEVAENFISHQGFLVVQMIVRAMVRRNHKDDEG